MQQSSEQASCTPSTVLRPVNADALDPKERTCCICFQPFSATLSSQGGPETPVQLRCGHVFGEVCILTWTLASNSCPLCREDVFGNDDHHANRDFSNLPVLHILSSSLSPLEDIWLDEYVWSIDAGSPLQDVVSSTDIETSIDRYTDRRSALDPDPQPQACLGRLTCAEHRGSCHCTVEGNIRNAALSHKRLTTPTTVAQPANTYAATIDFVEFGSQSAEPGHCYRKWVTKHFNEPTFGEEVFVW